MGWALWTGTIVPNHIETLSHWWYASGMGTAGPIVGALDRAGYRLTGPRRALADLIADQDGHFTAADLFAATQRRRLGVGRATVFRTLEVLEELGAIERLDLPNGEHAYVGCEPAHHHHHVVCSRCGRTAEIRDADLRRVVGRVSRQTGYRVDEHRLELFGLCPTCLAGQPPPDSPSDHQ
jgi:Fur family ferric uptake transcriptional regulator